MSGWTSAFLGSILLRVSVGGAVLAGMKFLWDGFYAFGAFVLVPLALYAMWEAWELFSTDPLLEEGV